MDRYLKSQILTDLDDKMVLLAGPRQVGKTTLAKSLYKTSLYMNWDIDEDRTQILNKEFQKSPLWIFDEIHKYPKWRNYLKGIVDKTQKTQKILVTGSAKLDVLRKGGDSLQGRYHFLRLMPLTVGELKIQDHSSLLNLFSLSGFPEPFLKGSKRDCDRWSRSYRERIVRQEVATTEQFHDLATIELLLHRLPDIVGGLFSATSLAQDLQVDVKTLIKWVQALERLYAVFKVAPFGPPKLKAVQKAQKLFFYDWNSIPNEGARFENFIAVHLLKWICFEQDTQGRNLDLRFYRDKYDHEVDFVVIENNRPVLLLETKLSDVPISKGLRYLKSKYPNARAVQISLQSKKVYVSAEGVEHIDCLSFLQELV